MEEEMHFLEVTMLVATIRYCCCCHRCGCCCSTIPAATYMAKMLLLNERII